MFQLFSGKRARKTAPSGPRDRRAYAIGDVHGRLDLLVELLHAIAEDDSRRGPAKTYLVFLGDLVDRGPDSCGVLDYLIRCRSELPNPVFLMGNHEEYFLDILSGAEHRLADWLTYGGRECLQSYGLRLGWLLNATPAEIAVRLHESVPSTHIDFLRSMADSFKFGDYLFVHAGIRPGIPLEEQASTDLRWIRNGFLESQSDHGFVVVHGHTIVEEVEEHPNRIAVDTGAYRSGVLTAVGIEETERWYLTVRS